LNEPIEQMTSHGGPGLGYGVKIMYGVGEIANSIKVVTFGLYSLFFATAVMGLPGTWVGVVGLFAMVWDAVIDPYIGYLTDGARAASRRYDFMFTGALTMGAGFWAFFDPPRNLSTVTLFAWLLAASFVVRTATSMYSIPYAAIGVNLSQDYHERTSITAIRGMASTIGTLLTASLSFVLFFPDKVPGVDPKLNPAGYASMGLTFGLVMSVVALTAVLGTLPLRNRQRSHSDQAEQPAGDFFAAMWRFLHNPSVRVTLICSSLGVMALAINSSLLVHYLKYYVEINGSVALSASQGVFFGAGLLGTVFWLRISSKFEKSRLYVFSAAATSALMLASLPLFGKGHPLGTGDVRPLLVGYGVVGFFNCILWFIPQSMLADVADENELITGRRREGALLGMFSFGQQVATGLAILTAGVLLDKFVGLVAGGSQPSPLAVFRIAIVYSVVPGALFMAAAFVMLRYKLTRARVATIQAELRQRRSVQIALKAGVGL
jgi:GPH family glycoside/pentoside/hexuronide:cation symporter